MGISLGVRKGLSKKTASRARRQARGRKKVFGYADRPRLVVTKSSRHTLVQVIDDVAGRTLASASTMEPELRAGGGDKTDKAKQVGTFLKMADGLKVTEQEGFVAIDHASGNAVKFVDRLSFSNANFNDKVIKGWQR